MSIFNIGIGSRANMPQKLNKKEVAKIQENIATSTNRVVVNEMITALKDVVINLDDQIEKISKTHADVGDELKAKKESLDAAKSKQKTQSKAKIEDKLKDTINKLNDCVIEFRAKSIETSHPWRLGKLLLSTTKLESDYITHNEFIKLEVDEKNINKIIQTLKDKVEEYFTKKHKDEKEEVQQIAKIIYSEAFSIINDFSEFSLKVFRENKRSIAPLNSDIINLESQKSELERQVKEKNEEKEIIEGQIQKFANDLGDIIPGRVETVAIESRQDQTEAILRKADSDKSKRIEKVQEISAMFLIEISKAKIKLSKLNESFEKLEKIEDEKIQSEKDNHDKKELEIYLKSIKNTHKNATDFKLQISKLLSDPSGFKGAWSAFKAKKDVQKMVNITQETENEIKKNDDELKQKISEIMEEISVQKRKISVLELAIKQAERYIDNAEYLSSCSVEDIDKLMTEFKEKV